MTISRDLLYFWRSLVLFLAASIAMHVKKKVVKIITFFSFFYNNNSSFSMFCHKNSKLKYDSTLRALYKSYVHQWLNKILVHRRILFSHFFSDIVYILMESSLR